MSTFKIFTYYIVCMYSIVCSMHSYLHINLVNKIILTFSVVLIVPIQKNIEYFS